MRGNKRLIVNADDFGQSPGVNRGVIEAHEHGIVTSASLMVRWSAAVQAASYARAHAKLSVGLHLDLGEWAYRNGEWIRLYQVVAEHDPAAVARELEMQLEIFCRLLGRGPTHLDSHQHCHRDEPVRSIVLEMAKDLNLPVRWLSPEVQYCGAFYGQTDAGMPYPKGISVEHLLSVLKRLPDGCTELGCHPGRGNDVNAMYQTEREREVETLCDPRIRDAIRDLDIDLASFDGNELLTNHNR